MSLSRREFIFAVPAAGAALALMPAGALALTPAGALAPALMPVSTLACAPIVSFHLDQPYFDLTGLEKPYIPPVGMRSAEPLAALGDEALSRFYGYI
jgi:hypothetical protein